MTSEATVMHGSFEIAGARLEYHHSLPLADRPLGPVILLHPWFGCWQFWRQTVDALAEFETYAVDLYSLGAHNNWPDFASPRGLAQAVGVMTEKLGIRRCSLIGNSMGGIAGQALAAAQPDRIEKLILVGTGARIVGLKPDYRQTVDNWIAGGANRESTMQLVDALLARRPADPREFETFVDMIFNANKAFMGSVLTNAFDLDLRPTLPQITAATLVIRGERDAARTPAHVAELLAGIPNSTAVEIPDAGHSPQVDSPQAFAKLVREFLLA
jgi:pimeloyl-ACP methyl ester carboxylesterase